MDPIINPTGPVDPTPGFVRVAPEDAVKDKIDVAEADAQSSAAARLRRAGPFVRLLLGATAAVLVMGFLFLHIAETRAANGILWNQASADTGVLAGRLARVEGLLAGWLATPEAGDTSAVLSVATRPGAAIVGNDGAVTDDGDPIEHRAILLLTHDGSGYVPLGDFAMWADDLPEPDDMPERDDLEPKATTATGEIDSLPVAVVEDEGIITAFIEVPTDELTPPLFIALQRNAAPRTSWLLPLMIFGFSFLGIALLILPAVARREALLEQQEAAVAGLVRSKADAIRSVNQLDRTKSDFLTAVSHRFRSPLQVIQGAARLLADPTKQLTPEMTATLSKSLDSNATRLDELLQDLLDVDRLTRGTMEPVRRDLDVVAAVRDIVERNHGDRQVNVPDLPVHGSVDESHLERMLDHLLRNAVKFSPPGEAIDVRVERGENGFLLAVEDRGPGIPTEHRLRVFDPLYRVEDGRADPGVGIGLSLVARLAAVHGGRAWAEPREGGGSTIWLKIPDEGRDEGVDLWQLTSNQGS